LKLHKTVDRRTVKYVLLINAVLAAYGIQKSCFGASGLLVGSEK
jgi:hypothetical protein